MLEKPPRQTLPQSAESMRETEVATEPMEKPPVSSIPDELTRDGLLLVIDKVSGSGTKDALVGKLMNGPIEIGKPIITAMGNTSAVESITATDGKYLITTKSGSEYCFDPSKSFERSKTA